MPQSPPFAFLGRRAAGLLSAALLCSTAWAAAVLPAPAAAAPDAVASSMKSVLDNRLGALVTVKFVMKYEGFGQDSEVETEVPGVMIEPGGLVICSNLRTGGMAAMLGGRGGSMTPRDMKILVGDDTEGVESKLIARDSELDLAWVQIDADKAGGKTYAAIDFSTSVAPEVGDTIFTVARLGKFFDRAAYANEGRVLGLIRKPRTLIYSKTEDYGAPVFNLSGNPVGLVIVQTPSREDMEGGGENQERGGLVILPGSEILPATVKAKEAAASGKPVDPPAPPAPPADPAKDEDSAEEPKPKAPQGEPAPK